jgi:hypothetical protein
MPRPLSPRAMRSIMAEVTDEAFILLVTFWHPSNPDIFRACLNTEPIISNGNTFEPTYFEITLPETSDKAPQGCQLSIDNVDRRMVELLRSITDPVQVQLQLVLASQPNVIEMQIDDLVLREVTWDASRIEGTLSSEDPLNQMFPSHLYEPRTFPGIY